MGFRWWHYNGKGDIMADAAPADRGSHCHPWCYHNGQTIHRASQERILGKQNRQTSHRPLQGYRKVRFYLGETDPCSKRYWHRVCSCAKETFADGWNRRL